MDSGARESAVPQDSGYEGEGSAADSGPPASVITDAVQVSAGEHHTCAVRAGGNVYCWGSNNHGQLGLAPTQMAQSNRPLKVGGVSNVKQVSAGYLHTCAVDANTAVWCWGANDDAQLGLGTLTPTELPQRAKTSAISGAAQVSAGEHHTCAVSAGGDIYCWGANGVGQVSTAATTSYPVPTLVMLTSGSATQISASSHHTCAGLQGSAPDLVCWGTQSNGELGTSATGVLGPTSPKASTDFLSAAAGHDHSCGLDTSNKVWCWGEDTLGQTAASPAATTAPPGAVQGLAPVLEVTAGVAFTCARDNAKDVFCWGSNANAQLGHGAPPDISAHATPTKVSLVGAAQISAGSQHACAVLVQGAASGIGGAGGPLVCWGNNADGELGDGTTAANQPAPVSVVLP